LLFFFCLGSAKKKKHWVTEGDTRVVVCGKIWFAKDKEEFWWVQQRNNQIIAILFIATIQMDIHSYISTPTFISHRFSLPSSSFSSKFVCSKRDQDSRRNADNNDNKGIVLMNQFNLFIVDFRILCWVEIFSI
jgi:hypothetical protein